MKRVLFGIGVLTLTLAFPVLADPGDPGDLGPQPVEVVPIDGGASLLAVAGAGYAARRLRRKKALSKPAQA